MRWQRHEPAQRQQPRPQDPTAEISAPPVRPTGSDVRHASDRLALQRHLWVSIFSPQDQATSSEMARLRVLRRCPAAKFSLGTSAATAGPARRIALGSAAVILAGCPQLLDDDFRLGSSASNGGSSSARLDDGNGGTDPTQPAAGAAGDGGSTDNGGASGSATDASTDTCPDCASCNNGVQDDGETGVDCGGACGLCGCMWSAFGTPEVVAVAGLTSGSSLYTPALSADGATLLFSSLSAGAGNIYSATRSDRGPVFGTASTSAFNLVNTSASETSPRFSSDGLRLYLSSDVAVPQATGGGDLYVTTRTSTTSSFGIPTALTALNSTALDELGWLSTDQLRIYFSSTRASSSAGANLWSSQRSVSSSAFDAPRPITELNTEANDQTPSLSPDELTIYFASDRGGMGSSGKSDIWTSTRPDTASPFGAAVALANVNSADDELDVSLSRDGSELFFSSDRAGAEHVLWRSTRSCQ